MRREYKIGFYQWVRLKFVLIKTISFSCRRILKDHKKPSNADTSQELKIENSISFLFIRHFSWTEDYWNVLVWAVRKLSQKFREIHFTKFLVKSISRNLSCLRFINTLHSKMAAVCSSKNTSSYVLLVPTVCKRSYTVHMLWRQNDRQNLKGQHRERKVSRFFS